VDFSFGDMLKIRINTMAKRIIAVIIILRLITPFFIKFIRLGSIKIYGKKESSGRGFCFEVGSESC